MKKRLAFLLLVLGTPSVSFCLKMAAASIDLPPETAATAAMRKTIEELFTAPDMAADMPKMGGRRLKKMAKMGLRQKAKAFKILAKIEKTGGEEAIKKLEERFAQKKELITGRAGARAAKRLALMIAELVEETKTTKDLTEAIHAVRENIGGLPGGPGGMGGMKGMGGPGGMRGMKGMGGPGGKKWKKHRKGKKFGASRPPAMKAARRMRKFMQLLTKRLRMQFMMKHMGPIKQAMKSGKEEMLDTISATYKKLLPQPTDKQVQEEHPFISPAARKELVDEVPKMHADLDDKIATIKKQLTDPPAGPSADAIKLV